MERRGLQEVSSLLALLLRPCQRRSARPLPKHRSPAALSYPATAVELLVQPPIAARAPRLAARACRCQHLQREPARPPRAQRTLASSPSCVASTAFTTRERLLTPLRPSLLAFSSSDLECSTLVPHRLMQEHRYASRRTSTPTSDDNPLEFVPEVDIPGCSVRYGSFLRIRKGLFTPPLQLTPRVQEHCRAHMHHPSDPATSMTLTDRCTLYASGRARSDPLLTLRFRVRAPPNPALVGRLLRAPGLCQRHRDELG